MTPTASKNTGSQAFPESSPRDTAHTRKSLMEFLKRQGECGVTELADELGVTGVAVRQHLSALEQTGQVAYRTERRAVGRPVRIYYLTEDAEQSFPHFSDRVSLELLKCIEKEHGEDFINAAFESRLKEQEKHYAVELKGVKGWTQRLRKLSEIREEEGFFCNTESSGARSKMVVHHCPLLDLAREFPQVCSYELQLVQKLTGNADLGYAENICHGGQTCTYESQSNSKKR